MNGSGKSTLLRIIAGEDTEFDGKVTFEKNDYTVGYLAQDPKLDENKTVKEIVQEGMQEVVDILKEYETLNNKFADPMTDDEMNKLMDRLGVVNDLIEKHNAWELDSKLERAMDALRCPDGEASVKYLSGGERPPCSIMPYFY